MPSIGPFRPVGRKRLGTPAVLKQALDHLPFRWVFGEGDFDKLVAYLIVALLWHRLIGYAGPGIDRALSVLRRRAQTRVHRCRRCCGSRSSIAASRRASQIRQRSGRLRRLPDHRPTGCAGAGAERRRAFWLRGQVVDLVVAGGQPEPNCPALCATDCNSGCRGHPEPNRFNARCIFF